MGVEPTREATPGLENKQFGAMADLKCDGTLPAGGAREMSATKPTFAIGSWTAARVQTVNGRLHWCWWAAPLS
jgi:hypothetical protein